jgi:uncharacterized protein with HEPN domain
MPKPSDLQLVEDIIASIARISTYIQGLEYDAFLEDSKTFDAVIRNIEIIGEATKLLSGGVKDACPGFDWQKASDMRNRLIHAYFGVNAEIVWDTITRDLPEALPHLTALAVSMKGSEEPRDIVNEKRSLPPLG